ncbi:homoserine O-succinyltransferase [Dongia mobilis]|uniref:Homoserine O-acetyltransferase n=1 Tax=Dongia mobilis TaxID=578943 RepID=A0A4R6WZX9_9PROT|nr:homoserine O-succinyltransferase [Dongia mobilis]TDQ83417.1 homoserine O-succinyltransferase [Dongia mobilis]
MPIKIPDKLPAFQALQNEGVRVMTEAVAIRQDIRPLQIGLLNLMPNKIKTELQIARLLGATPLQIELSLIRIGNHVAKNTAEDHLRTFYQTWEDAKHRKFDGFIITGTPVETIPYEDVTYWSEMQQIFDWTTTHSHSTINVCWGAMAALYHFHGVPKHQLPEKAFGVYAQKIMKPSSPYLIGFSDDFMIPISRWAEIRMTDLAAKPDVEVLAYSDEMGLCIAQSRGTRRLFVLDHMEYDATSLGDEYARDVAANVPIKLPHNYFPDDDPTREPLNRWRPHGHLFISNWINEIYQTTPFDIEKIGRQ